jgi:hypothetical protein
VERHVVDLLDLRKAIEHFARDGAANGPDNMGAICSVPNGSRDETDDYYFTPYRGRNARKKWDRLP